jgi:1-acyl-sn-glycerol-3-phosphate acyltransferase
VPWLVKQLDGIYVDRYNADFGALREGLKRLRKGGVLVLAPEGTRSPTGALIEARPGASFLAVKAGVPIIPVALTGTEDQAAKAQLKKLRRPKVIVRAGEPFTLSEAGDHKNRNELMQEYTDEIMCRIAAMLPVGYRGVYADHPRLNELLQLNYGVQDG